MIETLPPVSILVRLDRPLEWYVDTGATYAKVISIYQEEIRFRKYVDSVRGFCSPPSDLPGAEARFEFVAKRLVSSRSKNHSWIKRTAEAERANSR